MKKEITALIIGLTLLMLLFVGISKADPTTAPVNNTIRIHIDSIKEGGCAT